MPPDSTNQDGVGKRRYRGKYRRIDWLVTLISEHSNVELLLV